MSNTKRLVSRFKETIFLMRNLNHNCLSALPFISYCHSAFCNMILITPASPHVRTRQYLFFSQYNYNKTHWVGPGCVGWGEVRSTLGKQFSCSAPSSLPALWVNKNIIFQFNNFHTERMRVSILVYILFLSDIGAEKIVSVDGEVLIPNNYSLFYRWDSNKYRTYFHFL